MQKVGARTLARTNISSVILSSSAPVAKPTCRIGTALAFPIVDVRSLRFASNYSGSSAIRTLSKPALVVAGSQPSQRGGVRNMASGATDIEAFGKAASGTGSPSNVRGDCPFSQRIYLDLEEKKIPYKATYIQEGKDKPDWFLEKNPSGLLPVLRDGDKWIQDSEKIAQYLEEKFPEPSLKTPAEYKNIGIGIFPAFTSWLKSKNPDDETKKQLLSELKGFDEHLKAHGPYIGGEKPTESDFALIPKLRHLQVALKHYLEFEIPSEYSALHKYIELLESRESFKKTDIPDKLIVEGWGKKFQLPAKITA